MTIRMFQKGFNFAQDGPGNRLVYHLQGCNLSCPWCSNPEGMDFVDAIEVSVDEIVEEAIRCKPLFFDGGGVTFTGGECTCQFEGLKEALTQLKAADISTAIETNGTSPRLPKLFDLVDHLIMDVKHHDAAIHQQYTGLSNEQTLRNLTAASAQHPDLLVRIPLINGVNASVEDLHKFAAVFAAHNTEHTRFELLLYHEYGKNKWEKCGKKYAMENAFVPDGDRLLYESILREHGLRVVRT